MKYYIQSLENIQQASHLAYKLSRPTALEETATDVTQYCFSWIKHPSLDIYAACVPEDLDIPINPWIKNDIVNGNVVIGYLNSTYLPTEVDDIKNMILNSDRVLMLDLIPLSWVETSQDQLTLEGWFEGLE